MLVKLGVDISRLKRETRRVLPIVEYIYWKYAKEEAVITSTYEGNHGPGSLHYANQAVDFRLSKIPIATEIFKKDLGAGFDIVLEKDHLHIEFDPK